jgi:hypothetical protein
MQNTQTISPLACDYYSHDFKQIECNFLSKNEEFFRSVYFDFAPILLIPPYQKPLYRSEPLSGNTPHDYAFESLAYCLANALSPQSATTPSIFKTALLSQEKGEFLVQVSAFAYRAESRVSYISKYGNDGHWHEVPVEWQEYIPLSQTSFMRVGLAESKNSAPAHALYHRGYYAYIPQ